MSHLIDLYDTITGGFENFVEVQESRAVPTKSDYDVGFISRYFTKRANHSPGEVVEINKDTYDRLSNNKFFVTVSLLWKITGQENDSVDANKFIKSRHGVVDANRDTIREFLPVIPELKQKLSNLKQFWRGH